MSRVLLLSVRFLDGRYHGAGAWPPSPARLFQALIAGAAFGRALVASDKDSFGWLEKLEPPIVVAPSARAGQIFNNYVPDNDLDAVGGDLRRVGKIRGPKWIRPYIFDAKLTVLYAWSFKGDAVSDNHAERLSEITEKLYQLGRGVDIAWAWSEVLEEADMESRFILHGGIVYHPAMGSGGVELPCPTNGSLASLEDRFGASRERFIQTRKGTKLQQVFTQPPKARFEQVRYNSPTRRFVFDLLTCGARPTFAPWPLTGAGTLIEQTRDLAAEKFCNALPAMTSVIERVFIGRGSTGADKAARVRIVPLPSIGSDHADYAIRRLLVEVPPNCPLQASDVEWAFSGLETFDQETGGVVSVLILAEDEGMLNHYGAAGARADAVRIWRTVTPAVLPQGVARRRIDPARLDKRTELKGGEERLWEEARASGAAIQALRHAGVLTNVESVRVQREPFEGRGARAETFAGGTRFAKERLWHLEVTFTSSVGGPLIIGDGRYLGLGLLAPAKENWRDVFTFSMPLESRIPLVDRTAWLRAVRRALMALSRNAAGAVPRLFSGHEPDGARASSGRHEHIFLGAADLDRDGYIDELVVAAPWVCDRSVEPSGRRRREFDRVLSSLAVVRAGKLGLVALGRPCEFAEGEALCGPSQVWDSHTLYQPTRHASGRADPKAAAINDVVSECARRGLPKPEPELLELIVGPKGGVAARLRLRFAVAVTGPIMLGRDSHAGGGLFEAVARLPAEVDLPTLHQTT